jgi:hypothetical protein
MSKTIASLAALFALTLFAVPSRAEMKAEPDLQLEYDAPAGWSSSTDKNTTVLMDPKQETTIMLVKTDAKDAEKVMKDIDSVLASVLKDIKYDEKPTVGKTNELRSIQQRMTAKYEGKPMKGIMRILETPNKKYLVIVALAVEAKYEQLRDPINVFLKSIKAKK